jgi:hypothetical protein
MTDSTAGQHVTTYLPFAQSVFWMVVGILISIVLPIAVKVLQNNGVVETMGVPPTITSRIARAWIEMGGNRYLAVVGAAVIVALSVTFLLDLKFPTPNEAALGGFGWESLVNKLFGKPGAPAAAPAPAPALAAKG